MNKMVDALFNICYLEELSRRDEWINKINPVIKIIITLFYILSVTSVAKYNLSKVITFGVYPIIIVTISGIPLKPLLQKMILPSMAGASLGILNPLFDHNLILITNEYYISAGWLSVSILLIKSILVILSALILVSTTKIEAIVGVLRIFKFPKIMTIQFLLMYRYITILVSEVDRTITSYSMRSGGNTAVKYESWGSMIGQLFIRSSERSIRLYDSMQLRGFEGEFSEVNVKSVAAQDMLYLSFWIITFLLIKVLL